jgi:hypothetical protein
MEREPKQYKPIAIGKDHLDLILHGSELVRWQSWQALEEHEAGVHAQGDQPAYVGESL